MVIDVYNIMLYKKIFLTGTFLEIKELLKPTYNENMTKKQSILIEDYRDTFDIDELIKITNKLYKTKFTVERN